MDVDPSQSDAIQLVASSSIAELDESLFSELVIDPELHPFTTVWRHCTMLNKILKLRVQQTNG